MNQTIVFFHIHCVYWLTTLTTSYLWPAVPANIRIQIPVSTFHSRTDSSWSNQRPEKLLILLNQVNEHQDIIREKWYTLLVESTSWGFIWCVLISFTESPWPTRVCTDYTRKILNNLLVGYIEHPFNSSCQSKDN